MGLVLAVFAAPLLGAYWTYKHWRPAATMNYGELISPKQLSEAKLTLTDGTPYVPASARGKWLLLIVDSGECASTCEHKLYLLRQLRLALGKHQDRIERAWLVDDRVKPRPALIAEYPGTWLVDAADSDLLRQLDAQTSPRDYLYLVDPLGNLMMRYSKEPDPRRVLNDLNRLMKVSQVG